MSEGKYLCGCDQLTLLFILLMESCIVTLWMQHLLSIYSCIFAPSLSAIPTQLLFSMIDELAQLIATYSN
mgnify:CR=1 FL=1